MFIIKMLHAMIFFICLPLEWYELLGVAHNPQDIAGLECEVWCGRQVFILTALHSD
jgi:hypothetical protein